jgi:transposase, IS5 family
MPARPRRPEPLTAAAPAQLEPGFLACEVERIGNGKAADEFGVEDRLSPPMPRAQRSVRAALQSAHRNQLQAHQLRVERAYVDKGYRGHAASDQRRVFISGRKRRIKRALPRIGDRTLHWTHEDECHLVAALNGREGDAADPILSSVGYNLSLVLPWLRIPSRLVLAGLSQAYAVAPAFKWASKPPISSPAPSCCRETAALLDRKQLVTPIRVR